MVDNCIKWLKTKINRNNKIASYLGFLGPLFIFYNVQINILNEMSIYHVNVYKDVFISVILFCCVVLYGLYKYIHIQELMNNKNTKKKRK